MAAAADLKSAMDEIVAGFERANPGEDVEAVYGSSGRFHAQIKRGAPYDCFFSADIGYARDLFAGGFAVSEAKAYAVGRLVVWKPGMDSADLTLAGLADPAVVRIAIANPRHAPYGKRAVEALRASGLWEKVEMKLVFGENVSQAAQFVRTGNSEAGIIALSLAMGPELAGKGGYRLIPDSLHAPLEQGYIITLRGGRNVLAKRFADHMGSKSARASLARHGFTLPTDVPGKAGAAGNSGVEGKAAATGG